LGYARLFVKDSNIQETVTGAGTLKGKYRNFRRRQAIDELEPTGQRCAAVQDSRADASQPANQPQEP
jgi:hypothetical protein